MAQTVSPQQHTRSATVGSAGGTMRRPAVAANSASAWTVGLVALVIYLFVVHSYKLNIGFAVTAIGLFAVLVHERPLRFSVSMYWYVAFLVWAFVTVPSSTDPSVSWTAWQDAVKVLLLMFLALNTVRTPKQYRIVTLAWLGVFAFYPVRGTLFNFLTGNGEFGRYGWNFLFKNFNDMAALTLIPLALSIDRLRTPDKKWVKACALAGVISLPFIILITGSRGGLLGLAAMMMFLMARSRYRTRIAAAVAGAGLVAVLFAPGSVWERIKNMTYLTSTQTLGQADSSAEQRYLIWQVAEAIIADNPVNGVGIGTYPLAHQIYANKRPEWAFARGQRDAHSTYLRVLAENGVIGLALFLMIFLSAFAQFGKASRALKGSERPEDKQQRDRFQAYQAALVGLAVCATFGTLSTVVFPFLFIALGAANDSLRVTRSPLAAFSRSRKAPLRPGVAR